MDEPESRFELVSRRALLKRTLILGTVVAVPGLGCSGSGDKLATAAGTDTGAAATGATPTTTAKTATGASGTASSTTKAATTAPAGPALPTGAQLKIDFTYTASATGGRINNPYVAVWLEDASGALVRTVAVWYKAREAKYLQDLRRWYTDNRTAVGKGGTDGATTASGATRLPGAYSLTWDGKTDAGAAAAQGDYFICIEAAREKGPYELIREQITLGTAKFDKALTPNGELTAAAVSFVV